tara:strand:+ start:557 stop:1309 length:753 start_codon:yes stop_codon:yes gene_type:complete
MKDTIKLDKIYKSQTIEYSSGIEFDKNNKKRPSWVRLDLNKKVIFIKILFNNEAFWYRRYFQDYFFPLENTSEDYKNYYNKIAENYESFVPQNKEMSNKILSFLNDSNINKTSKILDLGAGTGLVTEEISKAGYKNLTLLDISKEELRIAKSKENLKDANFVLCDLTNEEIKGKYDVIYETMALDYFKGDQMTSVLNKIKSALNKNGIFIVIDRHIYPEFDKIFKKIKSGKFSLNTPEGDFDYYYYLGKL